MLIPFPVPKMVTLGFQSIQFFAFGLFGNSIAHNQVNISVSEVELLIASVEKMQYGYTQTMVG